MAPHEAIQTGAKSLSSTGPISALQGSQEAVRDKVKVNVGWLNTYGASHASGYAAPKTSNPAWPKIRIARRFGAALVLHDIMQEVSSD